MELRIEREPCMLYETVELLYAFVNDIPAERLTAKGTYCIPEGELAGIMGAVCANLDPQDPDLHRYFARRPILDEPNQYTCLAFCMVYADHLRRPCFPGTRPGGSLGRTQSWPPE